MLNVKVKSSKLFFSHILVNKATFYCLYAEKETQFICKNAGIFGTQAGDIYQVGSDITDSLQFETLGHQTIILFYFICKTFPNHDLLACIASKSKNVCLCEHVHTTFLSRKGY